jgi:hypothetical protein
LKFEYRIVGGDRLRHKWGGGTPPSEKKLNELGEEGWDLVHIVNTNIGPQWVFKRARMG